MLVGASGQGVAVFHDDQRVFTPAETYRWSALGDVRFRKNRFKLTMVQYDPARPVRLYLWYWCWLQLSDGV